MELYLHSSIELHEVRRVNFNLTFGILQLIVTKDMGPPNLFKMSVQ